IARKSPPRTDLRLWSCRELDNAALQCVVHPGGIHQGDVSPFFYVRAERGCGRLPGSRNLAVGRRAAKLERHNTTLQLRRVNSCVKLPPTGTARLRGLRT